MKTTLFMFVQFFVSTTTVFANEFVTNANRTEEDRYVPSALEQALSKLEKFPVVAARLECRADFTAGGGYLTWMESFCLKRTLPETSSVGDHRFVTFQYLPEIKNFRHLAEYLDNPQKVGLERATKARLLRAAQVCLRDANRFKYTCNVAAVSRLGIRANVQKITTANGQKRIIGTLTDVISRRTMSIGP